jgi:hypothetical protein
MNTFNIQNTTFNTSLEVFNSLQIKSFPKDYNVYFKNKYGIKKENPPFWGGFELK